MHLDVEGRHVLLLQGPMSPFFSRFAEDLEALGVKVTKINFNPGDALFYRRPGVIAFRRPLAQWPQFFRALVERENIDAIFLFGDRRPIHVDAIREAKKLGVAVWVFEEGYLRPDYITLERNGVNGNSSLSRDADFYREAAARLPDPPEPMPVGPTFGLSAIYATVYALGVTLGKPAYRHYQHHRPINAWKHTYWWVRGGFRKVWYQMREKPLLEKIAGEWSGNYFFLPLQVYCDSQVQHSPFGSVPEFIEHVVSEFSAHAPAGTKLVIKHHPHDRAYSEYGAFIDELGGKYHCRERLVYVHDLHLPTILKHARGTITMNSTVGLSSLHHHTPVKVLGTAVYDMPKLTAQVTLPEFFHDPGEVDQELYSAFCKWLRHTVQLNGSFYRGMPGVQTATGLILSTASEDDSDADWMPPEERPGETPS